MTEAKTYWFKLQETTVRDAEVTAPSLTEARRLMREYIAGRGGGDMGGDAPVQLGDMRTIKMVFRSDDAPEHSIHSSSGRG